MRSIKDEFEAQGWRRMQAALRQVGWVVDHKKVKRLVREHGEGERMMERSVMMATMGEQKLFGMRAAYDEIVASAVKRQHEPQRVASDLLIAELSGKQARSIKCQIAIAHDGLVDRGAVEDELVDLLGHRQPGDLAEGAFLAKSRNLVLIGGTGTGQNASMCSERGSWPRSCGHLPYP